MLCTFYRKKLLLPVLVLKICKVLNKCGNAHLQVVNIKDSKGNK
jgi:hypothetical protein